MVPKKIRESGGSAMLDCAKAGVGWRATPATRATAGGGPSVTL